MKQCDDTPKFTHYKHVQDSAHDYKIQKRLIQIWKFQTVDMTRALPVISPYKTFPAAASGLYIDTH